MVTEAGGPVSGSKKSKREPLESAAAATEERAACNEERAPDRISYLADAVLREIVSLLPTKEGARTQLLATRWRHVWRSAPLNLDCGGLAVSEQVDLDVCELDHRGKAIRNSNLDHVVSRILAAHQAPVRRLCIPTGHGCTGARMEALFRSSTLDNLEELEFCYVPTKVCYPPHMPLPPASTFRFAATLRLANFGTCQLPNNIVQGLHFPQLKHLMLNWVQISECSVHHLIAGCPALECLLVYNVLGFNCLRINALRLRSISVRAYLQNNWRNEPRFNNLVIENAPCLERLFCLHLFDDIHVSVISAPRLETIGSINNGHPSFSRIIKCVRSDSLTTLVRLVKSLSLHRPALDLNKIIGLMRCFPYLEKLYIQSESAHVKGSKRPPNFWRHKHRNDIGCFDIRVKTIVLETYRGIASEVNFIEFFVLNARALELMSIHVETMDDVFIAKQQRLLQLEKKVSRGARFHFTTDRCLQDISDICHVRDLDLTDPFICKY